MNWLMFFLILFSQSKLFVSGRLGNGFNKNMNSPVLVTWRLPSLNPCQVVAVSCGGAHTLVLMSKPVPVTII
jgi:alpha-tubulin suppressor-like RCC1 family protein